MSLTALPVGMVYRFERFELDELSLTFRVSGVLVPLPIKPWATLLLLAQNAPDTVSKAELMDTVWLGRVVTEGVLTQVISRLRVLLGDDTQEWIKTVHGVGFRLTLPVTRGRDSALDARAAPEFAITQATALRGRPLWALTQALSTSKRTAVWLAERKNDHLQRVFKFAHDGAGLRALKRELSVTRVLQAAQTASGICAVIDADFSEAPFFIELPYFNGGNLVDFYETHPGICAERTRDLLISIARTLAECHAVGIIHGDIKPKNILLELEANKPPAARLADFGAALLLDHARLKVLELSAIHHTGLVVSDPGGGTLAYAAPELLAGKPASVATDAYAFGVTAFQLLCGEFSRPLSPGWEDLIDDKSGQSGDTTIKLLRLDIAEMCQADPAKRPAFSEIATRLASLDARAEAANIRAQELAEFEAAKVQALRREGERALDLARIDYLSRRRRLLRVSVIALASLLILACTGFFIAQRQTKIARQQQALAAQSALDAKRYQKLAEQTRDTLIESLIRSANPFEGGDPEMPISTVLEKTAINIATNFPSEPDFAVPLLDSFGTVLLLARHPEASENIYAMAAKISTGAADDVQASLHLGYAEALRSQGKIASALLEYQRSANLGKAAKLRFRAQLGLVNCLVQEGRTPEALAGLKIADAIELTVAEHPALLRDSLLMLRADIAIQTGAFDQAERQLAALNKRQPTMRPKLFSLMARSRSEQGDFQGALTLNAQAIAAIDDKIPVGNRDSLELEKTRYLFLSGDLVQASKLLEALLNKAPSALRGNSRAAAIRLKAEISFALGKKLIALEILKDAKAKTELALSINSTAFKEIEALERRWR